MQTSLADLRSAAPAQCSGRPRGCGILQGARQAARLGPLQQLQEHGCAAPLPALLASSLHCFHASRALSRRTPERSRYCLQRLRLTSCS